MENESFDFIVIGAGSAGCVVASRLSENGNHSVLLLEAGPESRSPWTRIPVGYFKTVFNPQLSWGYETEPEPELNGRKISWPRGKLIGGTGAINGMVYIRGQKQDFNDWRSAGNVGWGYDDLLPYFRRSERQAESNRPLESALHGDHGPIWVSDYPDRHPLCESFIQAASEIGIPLNSDFNGASQEGAGYYQITTKNGLRCDTRTAYLAKAQVRKNLTVCPMTSVTEILFHEGRATGVRSFSNGREQTIRVDCELIICAGAVNSPLLLQASGIGDATQLARLGIKCHLHLPGVGKNLQDHLQCQIAYESKIPITINDDYRRLHRLIGMVLRYALLRQGPIAGGPAPAGAFFNSATNAERPDSQIHFLPLSLSGPGVLDKGSGFTFNVNTCRPLSRGTVGFCGAKGHLRPSINANYLSETSDLDALVAALRKTRDIAHTVSLEPFRGSELRPGEKVITDDELAAYVRSSAASIYHPVGTCKMGKDDLAVVDENLKLIGLSGVRVVDASVMPTIVSGNTNSATVAIAEKASDLIISAA